MNPQITRGLELIERLRQSDDPEFRRTAKALELMLGPVCEGYQKALDAGVPGHNIAGAIIALSADAVANLLVKLPRNHNQPDMAKQASANFDRSLTWSMLAHRELMKDTANDNRP